MRLTVTVLSLVILLLLAGVLPVAGGRSAADVYYSPVMIALLALLGGLTLRCCFRRKFRLAQTGFYLTHLGAVAVLAGALTGHIAGTSGTVQLSLMPPQFSGQLLNRKGDPVPFGFDLSAHDFKVEFYPPLYRHYRPLPPEQIRAGGMPFALAGEFSADRCREWDLGPSGRFTVSNLQSQAVSGGWLPRFSLQDGSVLILSGQTPRFYGVTLHFRDGDGKTEIPVAINRPAGFAGWRFYLMSYDQRTMGSVQLMARRDPGRRVVIAGIWMLIAGAFWIGLRRTGRQEEGV